MKSAQQKFLRLLRCIDIDDPQLEINLPFSRQLEYAARDLQQCIGNKDNTELMPEAIVLMLQNLRNIVIDETIVCSQGMAKNLKEIAIHFVQENATQVMIEAFINVSLVCDFHEDAVNHLIDLQTKNKSLFKDIDEVWQNDRAYFRKIYYTPNLAWSCDDCNKHKVAYIVWCQLELAVKRAKEKAQNLKYGQQEWKSLHMKIFQSLVLRQIVKEIDSGLNLTQQIFLDKGGFDNATFVTKLESVLLDLGDSDSLYKQIQYQIDQIKQHLNVEPVEDSHQNTSDLWLEVSMLDDTMSMEIDQEKLALLQKLRDDKIRQFEEKLKQTEQQVLSLASASWNEERDEWYKNLVPQYCMYYQPLEEQLKFMIQKYDLYKAEEEKMNCLFASKREMASEFCKVLKMFIWKLRAFQFRDPSIPFTNSLSKYYSKEVIRDPLKIAEYLQALFQRLNDNAYISVFTLEKLHSALQFSITKLGGKCEGDVKLQTDYFKSCLTGLATAADSLGELIRPRLEAYQEIVEQRKELDQVLSKTVRTVIEDQQIRKDCNRLFDQIFCLIQDADIDLHSLQQEIVKWAGSDKINVYYTGLTMAGLGSFKEYLQVEAQCSKHARYTDVWNKVKDNKAHEKFKTNTIWYSHKANSTLNEDPSKCLRCGNELHQGKCKELTHVVKLRFESYERNYNKEFGKFLKSMMVNFNGVEIKKFVFGMLFIFKRKGLVGKEHGNVSKKALVLMLLTWLIHKKYVPNPFSKTLEGIVKEKRAIHFPERKVKRLAEVQVQEASDLLQSAQKNNDNYFYVNYMYNVDIGSIDDFGVGSMHKKLKSQAVMCVKFLKFLCANTFKQQLIFDLRNGKIIQRNLKDNKFNYWKIRDPFIKEYNHAHTMMMPRDKEKFADAKARLRQGIKTMGEIILAVGKGDLFKELS